MNGYHEEIANTFRALKHRLAAYCSLAQPNHNCSPRPGGNGLNGPFRWSSRGVPTGKDR